MEGQVRWFGCFRRQGVQGLGGREHQESWLGRYWTAGQRYAQGDQLKKIVPPAARRGAVAYLEDAFEVSEWRACSVLRVDRTSMRYRGRRPSDAAWLRLSPSTLLHQAFYRTTSSSRKKIEGSATRKWSSNTLGFGARLQVASITGTSRTRTKRSGKSRSKAVSFLIFE